jgi:hypothetical protein
MQLTPLRSILALLLLALVAAIYLTINDYAYPMWFAYQGYCPKAGRKLSAAERFNFALDDYLRGQELWDLEEIREIERKDRPSFEELKRDFAVIPYSSRKEFLAVNPQCCQLTWSLPEGQRIGFWEMADDSGDGYFDFSHKIRYVDRQGNAKEITSKRTYWQVMNCGHPQQKFYY